jgi:hypothetical protein
MFLNFTYNNPKTYDKKYKIMKQLEVEKKITEENRNSIVNSIIKKDYTKIPDIETNIKESKELITNEVYNDKDKEMVTDITKYKAKNLENLLVTETPISDADIEDYKKMLHDKEILTDITKYKAKNLDNLLITEKPLNDADIEDYKKMLHDKEYYEIDNINKDISNKINIDFVDGFYEDLIDKEEIIPYNVDKIRKRGIKTIFNVYQTKYNNGKNNGTGFGDFIRGCYFLLEFCEIHNFSLKIIFNNCISNFLSIKLNGIGKIKHILSSVEVFNNNNFKEYNINNTYILYPQIDKVHIMSDFVDYITKLKVYNNNVFTYCISYPLNSVISDNSKRYMRKILEPTTEIKQEVTKYLTHIELKFKDYTAIHIRSGDDYLKENNKIFYIKYIDKLKIEIQNIIYNDVKNNIVNSYLMVADNNEIKILLKNNFPEIKIILKEITHLGEGVVLEEEKVKQTLIDFYLLSFAKKIYSFSSNKHGSGFSYWCAETFNIPYTIKYITT